MSKKSPSPAAHEGARGATEGAAGDASSDRGRFSSRRKMDAVLRLLRGETLDAVSREFGVSGATLGQWRDPFVAGGQGSLRSRDADERDAEIHRLRAKVSAHGPWRRAALWPRGGRSLELGFFDLRSSSLRPRPRLPRPRDPALDGVRTA